MKDHFEPGLMTFLRELAANNQREWFEAHRPQYEQLLREPAFGFINAMTDELLHISPFYEASARKNGGSLMRINRDVRFGHDKRPYKTNVGIQFRHQSGRDVHAPGFYLHIEPDEIFVGVGVWHPAAPQLAQIRDAIVEKPQAYRDAIQHPDFLAHFSLAGDSLIRPPRGYDPSHPLIHELKRKDFIALCSLNEDELWQPGLAKRVAEYFAAGSSLQAWLCQVLGLRY